MPSEPRRTRNRRLAVAVAATLVVVVPLAWMWLASLAPASFSVLSMGAADGGGVLVAAGHGHAAAGGRDVTTLVDPQTRPDVRLTLTARRQRVTIPHGPSLTAYTLNGTTPGPTLTARQGDLVEVTLVNESVPGGTTLHWHGYDVPGAEDGVAGVTQDAVAMGGRHTYRFVARDVGTYWYHSHQVSHEQVVKGLYGALVVTPRAAAADVDVLALAHLYAGRRAVNGTAGDQPVTVAAGRAARVRVVNTDNGVMPVWVSGASFEVAAVDGRDVNRPTPVQGAKYVVPAGGRVDLRVTVPQGGGAAVRVELGGAALVLGPPGSTVAATRAPARSVDLLSYGSPAPLGFDPASPDRRFSYSIGRRPGFVNGRPGVFWTVNGMLYPRVPMFMVSEGDVVTMRVDNHSGETHPMHLHGHHVVVLARDGKAATGSPWWTDSLEVASGEVVDVAFVADNPGLWMDHCHNLPHAQEGLVAHLMYEGITTHFRLGRDTPNSPE